MDEAKLLLSRIDDLVHSLNYRDVAFLGFLNENEASVVNHYLKKRNVNFRFFGGYDSAKRVIVAVYGSIAEVDILSQFPIDALKLETASGASLSHKDYLGSLMGLGIKRECVGDIVTDGASAVVFLKSEISDFVSKELAKVGREGVKITLYEGSKDELSDKFEEISIIVTSMRIDNVVSSCANISRNKSVELISSDKVFLNYSVPSKVSATVNFGDILSIRGYGKYKILEQTATTKRDRMVISVLHYI